MTAPTPNRRVGTMKTIDMASGKVTSTEEGAFHIMPPADGLCQICAGRHNPEMPHNAQSLYYQMAFHGAVGRFPTWADALAHCEHAYAAQWKRILIEKGAWSEPPAGTAPVKHHGRD